jgi:hypothetical protein
MSTHELKKPTSFVKNQQYNKKKNPNSVPRGMNFGSGAHHAYASHWKFSN